MCLIFLVWETRVLFINWSTLQPQVYQNIVITKEPWLAAFVKIKSYSVLQTKSDADRPLLLFSWLIKSIKNLKCHREPGYWSTGSLIGTDLVPKDLKELCFLKQREIKHHTQHLLHTHTHTSRKRLTEGLWSSYVCPTSCATRCYYGFRAYKLKQE